MPALSRARTRAIARLGDELRFASRETLVRHLDRIEELAAIIEPDAVYPEDFIIFRVTGYRPDETAGELITADTLLADLSALAERVSESAHLREQDLPDGTRTLTELSEHWEVSRKTIERYRRLGLIARRVDRGSGRRALVFSARTVEHFEQTRAKRLKRASGFTRLTEDERAKALRWARRYARSLGFNASASITRIADRLGRSREAVRQTIAAHDASSGDPIYPRAAPSDEKERREMLRRAARGARSGTIAAQRSRTSATVARLINRARLDEIRASGVLTEHENETDESTLELEVVRSGLWVEQPDELGGLIAFMRRAEPAVVYEQTVRAQAARVLAARCAREAGAINESAPSGAALDRIETDMRWIAMLRAALLRSQLTLILQTIEERLGGPIESVGPGRATEILEGALASASEAVRAYAPSHGGRLAARVGLAITRFAARLPDQGAAQGDGRAARLISSGNPAPRWADAAWSGWWWLRPAPPALAGLDHLSADDRSIITRRCGLDGERPWTLAELADARSTTPLGAHRLERGALRRLHTPRSR